METTSFTYKTGPCSDVLIIGGGLAGMYSALAAAESGAAVRILCKSKTGGSGNSVVAMSVHRFAPDAPGLREDYRRRFLASGAGQQDAELAAFFVDHAAAAMERLRGLGLLGQFALIRRFALRLHGGLLGGEDGIGLDGLGLLRLLLFRERLPKKHAYTAEQRDAEQDGENGG